MARQTDKSDKFHDSMELEWTLLEFFGHNSSWYGTAGSFNDPKRVREALLASTSRIRARLGEIITMDERLLLITSSALDEIEGEARKLRTNSNNQLEIIAHLLNLIAYLLGYDRQSGKPNRHVVYFQTADQERIDDITRNPGVPHFSSAQFELEKRREIVCMLYDQQIRVAQIARIMRSSEPMIRDLLMHAGKMKRKSKKLLNPSSTQLSDHKQI